MSCHRCNVWCFTELANFFFMMQQKTYSTDQILLLSLRSNSSSPPSRRLVYIAAPRRFSIPPHEKTRTQCKASRMRSTAAQLLLEYWADPNAKDKLDSTPLQKTHTVSLCYADVKV